MTTKLPSIIGLPPWNLESRTNEMILNSMPIAEITPSIPSFAGGLDLFRIYSAVKTYRKQLLRYGFDLDGGDSATSLKVAFLADSFPTDTFSNEYGENFLQKFTDVVSEGAASIAQFMGARTATEGIDKIIGRLKGAGGMIGAIGGGLGTAKEGLSKAFDVVAPKGSAAKGGASMINQLAAGARIDFPQVWKTSSFSPSYTMTIRLYNPNPRSDASTDQYIVGPIAALMLLGIPQSKDAGSYNWPYLHSIKATGIYTLDPAFIQSVTIVKGGDQQQISANQRLSMVDVRIDFGSLYSTMIASTSDSVGRPTLKKYLNAIKGKRVVSDRLGETKLDSTTPELAAARAPTTEETSPSEIPLRVDENIKAIEDFLKGNNPPT